MAQLKVSELPKEEQDKLIAEANELNIRGILTQFGVDTLKAKIEEARAKVQENEQGSQENKQDSQENEQDSQEDEQDSQEDEQNPPTDEQKPEEGEQENKIPDNNTNIENDDEIDAPQSKEVRICHICRSKVIDGRCSGCGFWF